MKKISLFLIIVLALSVFNGCSSSYNKYNSVYMDTFDTVVEFTAFTKDADIFNAMSEKVHSKLLRLTKLFDIYSTYDDMNNLKTINDNAGIAPVKVDNELIELIEQGKQAYYTTNGTINIAMGSVLSLWHNSREQAEKDPANISLPTDSQLQEAAKHCSIESIIIDKSASTIYISDKNTSIDVGAVAKGYASARIIEMLKADGIDSALLNMGGNVAALNGKIKSYWTIGITDPNNPEKQLSTINISNQYAISSGNYQRYFDYNGIRYHHIIDPSTLYPSKNNKGVTVITSNGLDGDMLSTALFILPYEQGKALADKLEAKAMWVTSDNKTLNN